jgi:hypothetical protein
MSIRHGDVKRQGSPKAVRKDERHPGLFVIQITLNIAPDKEWVECFRNPRTFILEEAHPKLTRIWENIIEFRSSEEHLKENIEWMDKYIGQANECYSPTAAGKEAELKKQEAKAIDEREKLEAINKMLGRL